MKNVFLFIAFFSLLSFSSCKKVAGPGGSSAIIGKVYVIDKDAAGNILSEYYGQKEDVFIVYGEEGVSFDDDVKTSYDGSFKFDYLEVGKYTIFLYEDCNSCPGGKQVLLYPVELTETKSTYDLGTITIIK